MQPADDRHAALGRIDGLHAACDDTPVMNDEHVPANTTSGDCVLRHEQSPNVRQDDDVHVDRLSGAQRRAAAPRLDREVMVPRAESTDDAIFRQAAGESALPLDEREQSLDSQPPKDLLSSTSA